jgi:hypothetical protein
MIVGWTPYMRKRSRAVGIPASRLQAPPTKHGKSEDFMRCRSPHHYEGYSRVISESLICSTTTSRSIISHLPLGSWCLVCFICGFMLHIIGCSAKRVDLPPRALQPCPFHAANETEQCQRSRRENLLQIGKSILHSCCERTKPVGRPLFWSLHVLVNHSDLPDCNF